MFTSIDKALVALIMGLLSIANLWFGIDLGISSDVIIALIAMLTPIIVWMTPNKSV